MPINAPVHDQEQVITTPQAAELLARPDVARLLKPFMRAGRTVAQAAAEMGVSVEALHYRVVRFQRVGLLEVVRVDARRGRPSKVYRATGTHYRIPAALLSDETLASLTQGESWVREVQDMMARHRQVAPLSAVTVHLTHKGALEWGLHAGPELPEAQPHVPGRLQLRSAALFLDPADADAFAEDLFALHQKYQGKHGRRRYGLLLDLAPLDRPVDETVGGDGPATGNTQG